MGRGHPPALAELIVDAYHPAGRFEITGGQALAIRMSRYDLVELPALGTRARSEDQRAMALRLDDIPDRHLYDPRLSPWRGEPIFRSYDRSCDGLTLTAPDSRH